MKVHELIKLLETRCGDDIVVLSMHFKEYVTDLEGVCDSVIAKNCVILHDGTYE